MPLESAFSSLSPSDSNWTISSHSSPSDAALSPPQTISVSSEELPVATAPRPFPTKKSHSRKKPLGHIPRPRNAFILFRCDYTRQNAKGTKRSNQNDVSCVAGTIWRNMTEEERRPWVVLAEEEKKRHAALYPGYKLIPRSKKRSKPPTAQEVAKLFAKEADKVIAAETVRQAAEANSKDMVTVYYPPWATRRSLTYFARRASSCPPEGAISVEPYTEWVNRNMVTTNARPEPYRKDKGSKNAPRTDPEENTASRSTGHKVFVPSTYDVAVPSSSARKINADKSLSHDFHNIVPPDGTSSWGPEQSSSRGLENASPPTQSPNQLYDPALCTLSEGRATSRHADPYLAVLQPDGEFLDPVEFDYWSLKVPELSASSPTDSSSSSSLASSSPSSPANANSTDHCPKPVSNLTCYDEHSLASKDKSQSNIASDLHFTYEFDNVVQPASETLHASAKLDHPVSYGRTDETFIFR
ncbi:hypothetical protein R3P38DRAFT_919684 [Favolaschia claudopus]|uniref:HMG box domain-containing protein n=1 Tax=Favolaschia claudopus TaxID=2862362 RepID=A0AAW0BRB9_9AGAR